MAHAAGDVGASDGGLTMHAVKEGTCGAKRGARHGIFKAGWVGGWVRCVCVCVWADWVWFVSSQEGEEADATRGGPHAKGERRLVGSLKLSVDGNKGPVAALGCRPCELRPAGLQQAAGWALAGH